MSESSFITDLDSLFLIVGLVALCLGFALEWVRVRETPNDRFARISLAISVACGLFVVGCVFGRIPAVTIATYTLIGLQIVALALILPVIRRALSDSPVRSLLSKYP
jgi:uncharacterized membrane protein YuzA (DUF378 family)